MYFCVIAFQILMAITMVSSLLDGHSLTARRIFQTLNGQCGPHFCMPQLRGCVPIWWSLSLFGMRSRR